MNKSLLSAALFALACQLSHAVVIPVSEDTYIAPVGQIGKTAGKENFMWISGDGAALLRFDVADYTGLIPPANVSSARLVFHFSKVKKASDLKIQAVTSEWTEAAQGRRAAPTLSATVLKTIPAEAVIEDQFAVIDVTAQVKQWLTNPASDFGLAVTCDAPANVQIASKEGVTTGHPAWLEIESHPLQVAGNDQIAPGVDSAKLGDGTVSNAEFAFLNGVLSPIQTQINTVISDAAGKVSKAGDTMTGPLIVKSDIKLGANGEFQAAAGDEKLRIVRGNILWDDTGMNVRSGKGFTFTHLENDLYRFRFDVPFAQEPTVMISAGTQTGVTVKVVRDLAPDGFTVTMSQGLLFQFLAVGAR